MRGTTTPSIGRATLESVIVAGPAKTGLGFYPPPTACLPAADAPLLHHHQSSISAWTPLHRCPSPVSLRTIPAFAAGHGSTCRAGLRYLQRFLEPSRPSPSAGPPCATRRLKPSVDRIHDMRHQDQLLPSPPLSPPSAKGTAWAWPPSPSRRHILPPSYCLRRRTTSTTQAPPVSPPLPLPHRSMFVPHPPHPRRPRHSPPPPGSASRRGRTEGRIGEGTHARATATPSHRRRHRRITGRLRSEVGSERQVPDRGGGARPHRRAPPPSPPNAMLSPSMPAVAAP